MVLLVWGCMEMEEYTLCLIIPAATRAETVIACQNEKKRMPLTQRNLGIGLAKHRAYGQSIVFIAGRVNSSTKKHELT